MARVHTDQWRQPPRRRAAAPLFAGLAALFASASCVPAASIAPPTRIAAIELPASLPIDMSVTASDVPDAALTAPADAPDGPGLAALVPAGAVRAGFQFRASSGVDSLRALDCLAQAVYYEARSESEDGQRAVAQVVLNRVRHPAWPNSVCGVVYQGPLSPGGGCQFTFTCDGSVEVRPSGAGWAQARRIAADALAGQVYAPIGLATHYHTFAVAPAWAPRLAFVGAIGAHQFYRLPGTWGAASAFQAAYAGHEPIPVPRRIIFARAPAAAALRANPQLAADWTQAIVARQRTGAARGYAAPADTPIAPPSTVRDEFRQSGQWRADAPAALRD